MTLQEYIDKKTEELQLSYRSVDFWNAVNVHLSKNSVSENFLAEETDLSKEVFEVDLSSLEDTSSIFSKENGSKVRFAVIPPRKRKTISKEFYVMWT